MLSPPPADAFDASRSASVLAFTVAVANVMAPQTWRVTSRATASRVAAFEPFARVAALALLSYVNHLARFRHMRAVNAIWRAIGVDDRAEARTRALMTIALATVVVEPLARASLATRAALARDFANALTREFTKDSMSAQALTCEDGRRGMMDANEGACRAARVAADCVANGVEAVVAGGFHIHAMTRALGVKTSIGLMFMAFAERALVFASQRTSEVRRETTRAEGALGRLRELSRSVAANGEAIALANGCAIERAEVMATVEAWQEFVYRGQVAQARTGVARDVANAACAVAPLLCASSSTERGRGVGMWEIQVAMSSFSGLRAALASLVGVPRAMAEAEAHAARAAEVYDALDAAEARRLDWLARIDVGTIAREQDQNGNTLVRVEGLTVCRPRDGNEMIRALDFEIRRGEALAVVGAPGSGKTALVKSLLGLWSWGCGTVRIINRASVCVLSKKPYMPQGGSLLDVCTYPTPAADIGAESHELLKKLIVDLGLSIYVDHLDVCAPWSDHLSLDEQQRFAVCRAVANRAELCVVDDATSAMSDASRAATYRVLKQYVGGILSLGDEHLIATYHTRVIRVHDGGFGFWMSVNEADSAPPPVATRRMESVASAPSFDPLAMALEKRVDRTLTRRNSQKKSSARVIADPPKAEPPVPPPESQNAPVAKLTRSLTKKLSFDPLNASPGKSS